MVVQRLVGMSNSRQWNAFDFYITSNWANSGRFQKHCSRRASQLCILKLVVNFTRPQSPSPHFYSQLLILVRQWLLNHGGKESVAENAGCAVPGQLCGALCGRAFVHKNVQTLFRLTSRSLAVTYVVQNRHVLRASALPTRLPQVAAIALYKVLIWHPWWFPHSVWSLFISIKSSVSHPWCQCHLSFRCCFMPYYCQINRCKTN